MKTCCGGIVGMGESREQRAGLLQTLANLPAHPDSVPINRLVQVEGTPLAGTEQLDPFEFVRTIAVARILMPRSMVRLSAGRETMSDELQALCFAGRRQFDLLRRETADDRQPRHRARQGIVRAPWPASPWHWSNRGAPCTPTSSKRLRTPQVPVPVTPPARPEPCARELA